MLLGEFQHNIDAKGRIIVPAKFREELGDCFYVTRGLGGCLWVFSQSEWDTILRKFNEVPLVESREISRYFFSGATDAVPDAQGRILIPAKLRQYAQLEKEVVVIGSFDRVEIWNAQRWAQMEEADLSSGALEAALEEMGM
jgi:MraZ protein